MRRASTHRSTIRSTVLGGRWPGWMRPAVLGAAAVVVGGLGCGDDSTGPPAPPPPPPPPPVATTVAVTPPAAVLTIVGDTTRFVAEVQDQNGDVMASAAIAWSSSDPSVASVDAAGLATAVDTGTVTVTATSGSASGGAQLAVEEPVATTLAVKPDSVTLAALDDTVRLTAEVLDQAGRPMPGLPVAWASGDTLVATVDSTGLVAAVGNGAAAVAVTSGEASGMAAVAVMQSAGSVTVSPSATTIGPGDTLRLVAEAFDANGHPATAARVAWFSDDASIATVDTSGLVQGLVAGRATISAASGTGRGTSVITVASSDRAALEALYRGTDGPNWVYKLNWLTDAPLGDWYGVSTQSWGRVVGLSLSENELSGGLPASLGLLEQLTEIRIDGNPLSGRLPLSLTQLRLREFHYGGTELCEPTEEDFQAWLGAIASHRGTGVECAPLTDREILEVLYHATGGSNWVDRDGWLTDAPLGEWRGVEVDAGGRVVRLDLFRNGLSGSIPSELGSLSNLEWLSLSWNELTGPIPPELGELANLRGLYLIGNDLTGPISPELGSLSNLLNLILLRNDLTGPIPSELGNLSNLEWLRLDGNELTGLIPPELGDLANLRGLYLNGNELTGPIPPALGGLSNLEWLRLDGNELTGPIPPESGDLANLRGLYLNGNELTGPIPPALGGLSNLEWLRLGPNRLTGPIPPELGGLVRLEGLELLNNALSGSLSPELGRLANLAKLDLSNNAAIFGALPETLAGLGALDSLFARGTGLCAPAAGAIRTWLDGVAEAQVASCTPSSAYLVQAVQSREFPVPLVAGEDALLRVFATAARASDATMPPVRARFFLDGTETRVFDIPSTSVPIPVEVDEGDLSTSANAAIPGEVIRPGLEMVVEVDPDGLLDSTLGVTKRIPAEGRLAVDVRAVPALELTVIPFLWSSGPDSAVIGTAARMAADPKNHELFRQTFTLLPVAEIEVAAHAPVEISSNSGYVVLRETEAIRVLEGGGGHYMGLMGRFSDVAGLAYAPGRSNVSVPHDGVIAHELGHNMSLLHAPCGGAVALDPRYPYRNGSIGAWGYDLPGEYDLVRAGGPVRPGTGDLMGFGPCHPRWISDYHFEKAFVFRLHDEGDADATAATRSILVWGGVDAAGAPFLEPAFVVDAPAALPDSAGSYAVTGRDAAGGELFSLSFTMPVVADGDGASSFVFAVPADPAWEGRLASVTLSGAEEDVVLDGSTNRPMAILRDPASGQVRGFFSELPQDVGTAAAAATAIDAEPGLRVLFSRGIPDAAAWRR